MKVGKGILFFLLSCTVFTACKQDNVPPVDQREINQTQILRGWIISSTKTYINVAPFYQLAVKAAGLEGKMENQFRNKAAGGAFYFKKDTVYFFRDGIVQDSSKYTLDAYKIYLENPNLIGFYAPYFYIKFQDELLIAYLRKDETMSLLQEDGSLDGYMGLIRSVVSDAECDLILQRSRIPGFD